MSNRANRFALILIGGLLLVGGGLSACLGAGVFGADRSNRDVFDSTLIRWWDEGGWMSFAVVVAIGIVALVVGLRLVVGQLFFSDRQSRASDIIFKAPEATRGETTLRLAALNHSLERDLKDIADVHSAKAQLYGAYPDLELRAVLEVGDMVDLEALPDRVDEVVTRMEATTGARPDPVDITLRFRNEDRERQIV